MKQETRKRIGIISTSLMISLSMMLSILPQGIKATEEDVLPATPYVNQSEEHIHDENCGYVEAKEEVPCNHIHDETCGNADNEGIYPECQHIHGDCSYQEAIEGQPCNVQNTILNTANRMGINQLNDVVAEEVEIKFDEANENAMQKAITNAMIGKDKSKIKTIKVIGNATSIKFTDWESLIKLFDANSGNIENSLYSNVTTLDLSEMSNLQTIGNYEGLGSTSIEPSKIKEVKLPNSLKTIERYTFSGCTNLTTINLPDGLEKIGDYALNSCSSLELDNLPDSIIEIGAEAFSECKNISLTKLSNSLKTLGHSAFSRCEQLAITELSKGITVINWQTFSGTGIKEIVIHDGITDIKAASFSNCSSLSKITFMSDIPTIADKAFNEIPNEVEIIYPANAKNTENLDGKFDEWTAKYILSINFNESDKNKMSDAISTALGGQEPSDIVSVKVTGDATSIISFDWIALIKLFNTDSEDKEKPKNLTLDLSEMKNLLTIGDYDASITHNIDPSKLKEVKLLNSLKTIGYNTFNGCTNLTTINIPDGLKKIGYSAFDNCSSLELDNLPDSIIEIRTQAFWDCENISLTKLPDSLKTLGDIAFAGCEQLAITELPKDIDRIDYQTFSGTGIKELVIHEGITNIEASAFRNCKSLSKITFKGNSPSVDPNAFDNISSSGKIYYPEDASGYEWIAKELPTWKVNPKETVPSGSSSSHSHYYGKQWKTDEENHWHECSCGKQKDVEAHEFDEWVVINEEHRERECRICGFIQKETFTQRQLTDALTGVQLSGTMSERAELVVSESPTHAVGLCSACDEIRSLMSEGKLIKAYEISLIGEYKGELTLSFPMDPKYNGESFMLYHYVEDGRADQLISVNNGKAEGKVQTLSPFAIVRSNETITQQVSLNQGEQITIYPATMDGVWAYDDEMIQLTQNKDSYTITAIKEGNTSAVYTTKTTQTIVDVNIPTSHVPNTNDAMNRYILISILSLCAIMIILFTKETTSA